MRVRVRARVRARAWRGAGLAVQRRVAGGEEEAAEVERGPRGERGERGGRHRGRLPA